MRLVMKQYVGGIQDGAVSLFYDGNTKTSHNLHRHQRNWLSRMQMRHSLPLVQAQMLYKHCEWVLRGGGTNKASYFHDGR